MNGLKLRKIYNLSHSYCFSYFYQCSPSFTSVSKSKFTHDIYPFSCIKAIMISLNYVVIFSWIPRTFLKIFDFLKVWNQKHFKLQNYLNIQEFSSQRISLEFSFIPHFPIFNSFLLKRKFALEKKREGFIDWYPWRHQNYEPEFLVDFSFFSFAVHQFFFRISSGNIFKLRFFLFSEYGVDWVADFSLIRSHFPASFSMVYSRKLPRQVH